MIGKNQTFWSFIWSKRQIRHGTLVGVFILYQTTSWTLVVVVLLTLQRCDKHIHLLARSAQRDAIFLVTIKEGLLVSYSATVTLPDCINICSPRVAIESQRLTGFR